MLHVKRGFGHLAELEHYINSVSSKRLCFSSLKWASNRTNLMGWSQGFREHKGSSRTLPRHILLGSGHYVGFCSSTLWDHFTGQEEALTKTSLVHTSRKVSRIETQFFWVPSPTVFYNLPPSCSPSSGFPMPSSPFRAKRGWIIWSWGPSQHPHARWCCSNSFRSSRMRCFYSLRAQSPQPCGQK